jgi:hypothetical protein
MPPFAIETLKEADYHQPEIDPESQRRTAQLLVIELPVATFAEAVEALLIEDPIQPLIKRMPRRLRQLTLVPQRFLPLALLACAHRHA